MTSQNFALLLAIVGCACLQVLAPKPRCTSCLASNCNDNVVVVENVEQLRTAVASLESGQTLRIAPGVYPGGFYVKDLNGLTVEALDPKQPPEFRGGDLAWHFSKCSQLTLRNLRCSGQRGNGVNIDDGGQLARPVTDLVVEGLIITDIGPKGNHDGIKLSGVDRFVIRDCNLHGWAGQGFDMVGCHEGLIEDCRFEGKEGYSASAGIQTKGGSSDIKILRCHFIQAGERPVNVGGSTGKAFFRPPDAAYEAARITVEENRFEGSLCAAAFVGVDGATFKGNTILYPTKWIFRMLQETTAPGVVPCRNIVIEANCIAFKRSQVSTEINVGGGTKPETMQFLNNSWLAEDRPESSRPRLPVEEQDGKYGQPCGSQDLSRKK